MHGTECARQSTTWGVDNKKRKPDDFKRMWQNFYIFPTFLSDAGGHVFSVPLASSPTFLWVQKTKILEKYPKFTHKLPQFYPQNCYFFPTKLLLFHHKILRIIFTKSFNFLQNYPKFALTLVRLRPILEFRVNFWLLGKNTVFLFPS